LRGNIKKATTRPEGLSLGWSLIFVCAVWAVSLITSQSADGCIDSCFIATTSANNNGDF
jgi:hypothetical protein